MLFRPIDVDGALTHGLEGAFHADRADIDMPEHGCYEQHRNHGVDHLGILHGIDRRALEREDQRVAGDGHCTAAKNHNLVDRLLPAVETIGWRMVATDDAAPAFEPLDIDGVRNVSADPH